MAVEYNPRVVTDGLVLALDAGNTKSYKTTITYVGGTSDSDNSSSFELNGLQSGDLVLYFSAEDSADVNTPTDASWTAIPGLTTQPENDNDPNSAAFYVFATGTNVKAGGLNTDNEHVRVMIAFRNVNSANPFDVDATENSGSGLPDPPSITPVTDNSMIVAVGLLDDHDIANSISPPTGYTTAVNMDSQGGANDNGVGGATIMTAYKLLATAAAEDPNGFTGTTGDPQKGITIALRPGTSLTWTDLSGNGINGTLGGNAAFNSLNGGSITFDGDGDYVDTNSELDLAGKLFADSNSTWSVSSWFNVSAGGSGNRAIAGRGNSTTSPFSIYVTSSSILRVGLRGTGSNIATISSGVWYNVVVTWDGSTAKAYLNGVFDTNCSVGSNSDISRDFLIGGSGINASIAPFNGKISSTLVHNRALTASEVEQNYNAIKGRYA